MERKWPKWRTIDRKIEKCIYPVTESEKKCVNEQKAMGLVRGNVKKRIVRHVSCFDDGLTIRL